MMMMMMRVLTWRWMRRRRMRRPLRIAPADISNGSKSTASPPRTWTRNGSQSVLHGILIVTMVTVYL